MSSLVLCSSSRQNSFSLLVALDDSESASGDMFLDNGDELDSIEKGTFSLLQFNASPVRTSVCIFKSNFNSFSPSQGQLASTLAHNLYTPPSSVFIDCITIYGLEDSPMNITYNAQPIQNWNWTESSSVSPQPHTFLYLVTLVIHVHIVHTCTLYIHVHVAYNLHVHLQC